ncbi:MAG TPA: Gfo/Idh/MocA family oxidoreductase [Stellaceae bacterium]|nr:Gfo/Idh/MocA family oxidoreductase [Stellaceae bacterium]
MSERRLQLGAAGLGRAFQFMLPAFRGHPRVRLAAAADPRPEARARFSSEFAAPAYDSVEALCRDGNVEAVYVATPHQLHAPHAQLAAQNGKHILVEKPMALGLADCAAMVEAASRAGVRLVVGHSHSFDEPIRRARAIIASGEVGALRMITALNFTDFLYRPRRREELVTALGGGVIFNQAPHQVDIIRLLGGGRVRSVRAAAGSWDRDRPTEGAYSAFLTFEDGAFASLTYSGFAHFDSDEWCDNIGENGAPKSEAYGAARRLLAGLSSDAERDLKHARNYGGPRAAPAPTAPQERFNPHFGVVVASCERADLRPTPKGVMIYDDEAARLEPVPPPAPARGAVLDELCDAIFAAREPVHGGAWGLATMEVCLAMLDSAREGREITLRHQTGIAGETPQRRT